MIHSKKLRRSKWKQHSIGLAAAGMWPISVLTGTHKREGYGCGKQSLSGYFSNDSPIQPLEHRRNLNGLYLINANLPAGTYTLQFSGVGYKAQSQALQIGSAASYTTDVQLTADALKMDEVIVTGVSAGTTRKQLGNHISTIKADELTKGDSSNVLTALQGKTAARRSFKTTVILPGSFSSRLRGISSVLSSSEPLYIVDGVNCK